MASNAIRLLAVDDDRTLLRLFEDAFRPPEFDLCLAPGGPEALEQLQVAEADVIVLDLNMPAGGGLEALRELRARQVDAEVIVLTGHGTIPDAVSAMQLGAYDFIAKPVQLRHLRALVEKAHEKRSLRRENLNLRLQLERLGEEARIVTRNPGMKSLLEQAERCAASDFPVLIQGETGTGKELVARTIHRLSRQSRGPFVPLNCGALPEGTLESELFGHERGAFTGANARKPGLLEVADRGTLFLDEIGELPGKLQSKLLRALDTGRFFRVGGTVEVAVRLRLVAATNRDIAGEIERGNFRADLYYRISTLPLAVPPLRERREDIPALVAHFAGQNTAFRGKSFEPAALERLETYDWPGNVRELQNVVYRLLLLSRTDRIGAGDVRLESAPGARPPDGGAPSRRLDDVEREHILQVLESTGQHRGRAARILGISPKTLYRKLRSYERAE